MSDHERTDVNVRGIVLSGVGVGAFVLVVLGMSLLMYRGFGALERGRNRQRLQGEAGSSSRADAGPKYAGPLLQIRPEDELAAMRWDDARKLGEYGWENRPGGAVRLPVEEAMKLLGRRGVPALTTPPVSFEDLQRRRGNPTPP